jgi:DNA-binding NtrC family response regulator
MAQILICDDDLTFQLACRATLESGGAHGCRWAKNTEEATFLLSKENFELILLDIEMRTRDEGLEFIPRLRERHPDLPILMCSGRSDFDAVRRALLAGAWDYLRKDSEPEHLLHSVNQMLSRSSERKSAALAHAEIARSTRHHEILGDSPSIQELRQRLNKYARSPAPVLILGETGTGKELAARALRPIRSDGTHGPFVAVDASTIPESTAESVLFGHEKGAFTGADKMRAGLFEQAAGGVIFFDELANMSLTIQQKLLRVLQEKEVTRMGAQKPLQLEFRVVAATNRDPEQLAREGRFLPDLVQRLNVLPLRLVPLRERRTDIPILAQAFLKRHALHPGSRWSEESLELMMNYDWPGNIRELQNVVHYAVTMAENPVLEIGDLPERIRAHAPLAASEPKPDGAGFYQRMLEHEAKLLKAAMEVPHKSVTELAARLGMDRSHLYTKLKQHGLNGR